MKPFNEIVGVEDFKRSYMEYQKRFVTEGSDLAGKWSKYVFKFLTLNYPKVKVTERCKIATIPHGTSFEEVERFVESIENFKVNEIVYDSVSSSFTFYGSKK